jgi:hypothetical protein
MNLRRLAQYIAEISCWSESDIMQRYRLLQNARIIPKNMPGFHASDFSASDAANLVVGIVCGLVASNVVDDFLTYAKLKPLDENDQPTDCGWAGSSSFVEAIQNMIENPQLTKNVTDIFINLSYPEATLLYCKTPDEIVEVKFELETKDNSIERGFGLRKEIHLDPGLLVEINCQLDDIDDPTWTSELVIHKSVGNKIIIMNEEGKVLIQMLKNSASPEGVKQKGETYFVPQEKAEQFVNSKAAVYVLKQKI